MNNSGDVQERLRKPVSLSRSLVLTVTEGTSISSLLILGKLHSISDGAADMASLRAKLLQEWAPSGTVNFWPVTNGAFLLQFNQEADLRRVMDGAPWSCHGDGVFLVRQVKPELNLVDQLVGDGFTTADLWVQFLHVPVDYFSTASLCALATSIGVPVVLPDLGAAPVELLRARIRVDITRPLARFLTVDLDDGSRQLVSVVYEQLPSLCGSCGIIGHPSNRCPLEMEKQPEEATAGASSSHGENPSSNEWTRLISSTTSSCTQEESVLDRVLQESVFVNHKDDQSSGRAATRPTKHLVVPETQIQRLGSAARGCSPWNNFFGLISLGKKKGLVGDKDCTGELNLQDMRGNQNNHTVLLTISAQQSVQESTVMTAEETQAGRSLDMRTLSSFQLDGGCVKYYTYYSGSGKNPRIEVTIETQCPPQLINKAMEWLSKHTGFKASYDGKRVVISIVDLQIDQMAPVDLVAYLYTENRPKDGVPDAQKKPDSPERFKDTIIRFYDENCRKGESRCRDTK